MSSILIGFYTRTSHTQQLGEAIYQGAKGVGGVQAILKPIWELAPTDLLAYDAIILGSPVYYGSMAAELKKLIDDSVTLHGQLHGKVGGAFATSALVGGGNETTVLDILHAMLIHGMIIPGNHAGDHYGPVGVGRVDQRAHDEGVKYGRLVAELAVKLFR